MGNGREAQAGEGGGGGGGEEGAWLAKVAAWTGSGACRSAGILGDMTGQLLGWGKRAAAPCEGCVWAGEGEAAGGALRDEARVCVRVAGGGGGRLRARGLEWPPGGRLWGAGADLRFVRVLVGERVLMGAGGEAVEPGGGRAGAGRLGHWKAAAGARGSWAAMWLD